jgi:defect in organelle trafficking protein DotD
LVKLKKNILVAYSFCSLLLVSCASTKIETTELKENSNEFIESMMVQKSSEAVDAQQQYAMIVAENRDQKNQKQNLFDNEAIDIIGFIGKPNILLKALANRYGYEFNEVNASNKNLPTITIDVKKQAPLEVLKMIGYQVDKVADLVLDKDARVIRLVYRSR